MQRKKITMSSVYIKNGLWCLGFTEISIFPHLVLLIFENSHFAILTQLVHAWLLHIPILVVITSSNINTV